MKIKKMIQDFKNAVKDPERDSSERFFLCLTIVSELAVFLALIGDIALRENVVELITLVVTLIVVPITAFTGIYKDRLGLMSKLVVIWLVFVILPLLFVFGGGVEGGGVLWIIFAFLFAGLAISGALRIFIFIVLIILTLACYGIEYFYPELIHTHSRGTFYVDSMISIIMVGLVCFLLSWIQRNLLTSENKRTKQEAERAEELTKAQNRFFSSMSHEIRTPINSILGLNELILRDMSASDEIVKDASGIQGAGKMLLTLINDILDFSKMEAGSMDIVPVDYRIGDMLSEIINMVWLRAQDKGLKFEVSIDPEVPCVLYGDEVRIKQVMINLLNNAVKYTAEGSVELHIESTVVDDHTAELHISVSDTGIGIKKEALPFLFDAFKRVDQKKNRMIEGTGLGLSIVKQIVELMDGTVTVSSVYGEGSTFTVVLHQGISNPAPIGELNVHNQQMIRTNAYESSFKAPEAAILIVDDNEMNLEVESKLLAETGMDIEQARNGKEALDWTLKRRFDVILMDHLMPEMDGIECLEKMRGQQGGLNRKTPVIVLTANAGSENRELYIRSGFDGYLVKPVSGEMLEETLIRHISSEKLITSKKIMSMHEDINVAQAYYGKSQVVITATSMCDLPDSIIRELDLDILPFLVHTEESVFKDGIQIEGDELIRYIRQGGNAFSALPDEEAYTDFFSNALKKAHHLIHIAVTTSMSEDYHVSSEAAKAFDNVIVINSECVSSAVGILVLIAHKLAKQNIPVDDIVAELEMVKKRLKCSFVIDTTEFMVRRKLVSTGVHKLAKAMNLHPYLRLKSDRSGIGGIWVGSTRRAYKNYIRKAFPVDVIPDEDILFITYVDIPLATLLWIKEEVSKIAYFEHVVFQKASAAISSNCGSGTFGLLYFVKGNRSYNLGSYLEDEIDDVTSDFEEDEAGTADETATAILPEAAPVILTEEKEPEWYQQIDCIDGDIAIKNSGSEDSFKTVLKIFYESIPAKSEEIENYYADGDWENYTIKVHALKSSAKLIGAMPLSEAAQLLETAGKEKDIDYILEHHNSFMQDYRRFDELLAGIFTEDSSESVDKPVADEFLVQSTYEGLREAAEEMDCDIIEEILEEISHYAIPAQEISKFDAIREKAENFDYDGLLEVLDQ